MIPLLSGVSPFLPECLLRRAGRAGREARMSPIARLALAIDESDECKERVRVTGRGHGG